MLQSLLPDWRATLERVLGTALDTPQGESRSRHARVDRVGRQQIYNMRRLA